MHPTIGQWIFHDRKIAYAITDRHLAVVEVGGAVSIIGDDPSAWLGCPLPGLVPELVGSEDVLADILAGDLPRFEVGWAYHETVGGQAMYLTMVDLPYRDRRGRIAGIIHLAQDVTDTGLVIQQLAQNRNELRLFRDQLAHQNLDLAAANAELRRLDEMKSMFVSVAAHELRTPLAPIRGYLEVLLDEEVGHLNNEQREYLEIVQESAGRLLTLANNLLDAARLETGRVELVLQPVDLLALMGILVAECGPQLAAKAQRLTLSGSPGLPPALCDEMRAEQIIGNLLSNACKYTPEGGTISVSLALAEEEEFLQVSVEDSGVGIPVEDQPRLFSRFFRAKSAVLARASGAGLGLFIARSLVELHGGRIWFDSELGQGSTFYVTFPVADKPAPSSPPDCV